VLFLLASQQTQLHFLEAVIVCGLVVGVFGHIIDSRPLILIGIVLIGLVSVYFAFVLGRLN
jgi:F0F1-type ATP synthase assembly protein I